MVEFAFGTTGLNPHYGTPKNPWDQARPAARSRRFVLGCGGGAGRRHVRHGAGQRHPRLDPPAGGAVRRRRLQADAAARAARWRVPAFLRARFDRPAREYAWRAAPPTTRFSPPSRRERWRLLGAKGLRLLVPAGSLIEDLDAEVARAFEASLVRLAAAGAVIARAAGAGVRAPGGVFQERRLCRRRSLCDPPPLDGPDRRIRPAHRQADQHGKGLERRGLRRPAAVAPVLHCRGRRPSLRRSTRS